MGMRFLIRLATLVLAIGITSVVFPTATPSLSFHAVSAQTRTAGAAPGAAPSAPVKSFGEVVSTYQSSILIWGGVAVLVLVVGGILLIGRFGSGANPAIPQLTPSFFFWMGMTYTGVLLLLGAIYDLSVPLKDRPILLGGILPVAVPWFGALGAVTISLEGVFLWNSQWDSKFNYWHIGRPLFGAVLGIVAFFLFVVIVSASGSAPKFLDDRSAPAKDYIIFYVVAFLVGYREETFRELIKRATDLILKPSAAPAAAPAVTFKVGGATPPQVQCPNAAVGQRTSVIVEVQNSGAAPLVAPVVSIAPVAPTPPATFATANDHVTGAGDLQAGQSRTVEVAFAPASAGAFHATLTVTAANLTGPASIKVTGTA